MSRGAPQLPAGCSLVALDAVGSTNDHAKTLARNGYPAGAVVWARAQTVGRGRQGNAWNSLPGNLFMTMILRPDSNAAVTGQLSFLAAVALARALRPLLPGVDIKLKWPNDLLINGKKAAGILLETEVSGVRAVPWVVIGVGVNIADAPEGAASLKSAGAQTDTETVLESLVSHIMALYAAWKKDGFAAVREEWMASAASVGQEINVRLPKETLAGTFLGIDNAGTLQLAMTDGSRRSIASGEVFAS
jgi:BirA family biotin operon repressor/biotin-[acetyl-CoA-carboxylase] ligase